MDKQLLKFPLIHSLKSLLILTSIFKRSEGND